MKSKTIILMIAFAGLTICGCNNDDDNTSASALEGTWNLNNVSGGLIVTNIDYNENDVIWTFNENSNEVMVENNVWTTGPEQIHSGPESGTYNYELVEEGENDIFYLDGQNLGVLTIVSDSLYIDNGLSLDGFLSRFVR